MRERERIWDSDKDGKQNTHTDACTHPDERQT